MLVTGSNRSGTTWVGRMLCLSRELSYVHEPFNPGISPRWLPAPIPHRNLYICPETEAGYVAAVGRVMERRFPWREQLGDVRSAADAARLARAATSSRLARGGGRGTLMKDPIAVFSAEWLADRFGMDVLVMVRGPLAFASSIKRLGWAFDFSNWSRQDLLMRDHLSEFADEIRRAAQEPPELVDQAILTWNATYAYVDRMRQAHPTWHVVSYEGLAADPIGGFRSLYGSLGLRFDAQVAGEIGRHSASGNPRDVPASDKGGIRRDSRAALDTWRARLTASEADLITRRTASVASRLGSALSDAS